MAGRGVKNDMATAEDPRAGVAGDTEVIGKGNGGERVDSGASSGQSVDNISAAPEKQSDNDVPKKKPTGTDGNSDNAVGDVAAGKGFEEGVASEESSSITESVGDVSRSSMTDNHGRLADIGSFCKRDRRWRGQRRGD